MKNLLKTYYLFLYLIILAGVALLLNAGHDLDLNGK